MNKLLYILALLAFLSSCGLDRYNNSDPKKLKDAREGDVYVYGVKGDSARQLKKQYEPSPEADKRAKAIREKLYGNSNGANLQDGSMLADTTKKAVDTVKKDGAKAETP
ncbi:MAG: hypothetical protein SFU27_13105, partial [Thermonemataceae bacterium]|nr:hypothetical protein [Thermonemataceae bacterium]